VLDGRENPANTQGGGMNETDLWTLSVILGLAVVTVLARSFFFISSQSWQLPNWAQRGLQYAPIAALSAVVIPEVITVQGELVSTWQDARLYAAVVGVAAYFSRRDVLITILAGMAVYLPLRLGLGW
jgi:branched-subunit amino acid transport protein